MEHGEVTGTHAGPAPVQLPGNPVMLWATGDHHAAHPPEYRPALPAPLRLREHCTDQPERLGER